MGRGFAPNIQPLAKRAILIRKIFNFKQRAGGGLFITPNPF